MKFINNTSDSIYLFCNTYTFATPTSSPTYDVSYSGKIATGETFNLFFPADATYVVFRVYKGASPSGNCLVPYINGVATDGKSDYIAAMNDPTIIDTVGPRTIEFNANSSEVSNSTRWAIHTTAIPDIVGKSYQLNSSITGYMAIKNSSMSLTGTIKSSTLEHEFNLTEPRLWMRVQNFEFMVANSDSTCYPTFFNHGSYGGYWRIVTGYSTPLGYTFATTEPPILTITGGDATLYYSMYEWLTENGKEVSPTDIKPTYLRKNGVWVKQNAYERQNGEWVQVSYAN